MNSRYLLVRLLLAMLVLLSVVPAYAATSYCVTNSQELQLDLSLAAKNKGDNVIRIARSATAYTLTTVDFYQIYGAMSLLGGYDANCKTRIVDSANTVIDFAGTSPLFQTYYAPSNSLLQFDGLTLQNGAQIMFSVGSYNCCIPDEAGNLRVTNTRITGFSANVGYHNDGTVLFDGTSSHMLLSNVLIDHIVQTGSSACAVSFNTGGSSLTQLSYLSVDLAGGKPFCFEADELEGEGGTFHYDVYNSVFWASDGGNTGLLGIQKEGSIEVNLVNDVFHSYLGDGAVTSKSALAPMQSDPLWVDPANGNYHLAASQPGGAANAAVNNGASIVPFGVTSRDIEGNQRPVGSHPDRGAYESPFDDASTLTVTSTGDDGSAGTLRAAITNANMYAGAHMIVFDLGGCPAVIYLSSPLPNITSAITVDGYTQAGSSPNDSENVFDASLCVLIKPATSALAAFRVPSNAQGGSAASLTLRGVGLGGFGQDVLLLGGANHVIVGNQFGGTANGVDLGTSSLTDITVGVDADSFVIGSFDLANRNVIGGAPLGTGINIQYGVASDTDHCQIVNNWIGFAPDGVSAMPNAFGVQVSGSGCAVVDNRLVGNSVHQLWINGGHHNVVQHNIIGYNLAVDDLPNSGVGILISGDDNTIGGSATGISPGDLLSNVVGKMTGGGIVVASGVGNSIRGNSVTNNGPNHDGAGMDIDLGNDGPTANGNSNFGPNYLQHFAVVDDVLYTDYPPVGDFNLPATLSAHLDAAPGDYRVDLYFSYDCSASGRGHAQSYLRDFAVSIPAGSSTAAFSFPFNLPVAKSFNGLALTATSVVNGTSEVGTCFALGNAVNDAIFKSGFGYGAEY